MSDPRQWPDPTQPAENYPTGGDPAYAGPYTGGQYYPPTYYGQGYPGGYPGAYPGAAPVTHPTEQLPTYWQPGMGYPPGPPPPPQPPKSPRWLWIAAAAAVLVVAGLVLALVKATSARDSTVVAAPTTSTQVRTTPALPSRTRQPLPTVLPEPTTTAVPVPPAPGPTTESPAGAETVVYSVTGEGRAINITYVDTGGVMQTEFNVALPWSKEVSLAPPAKNAASVAVVNVGRDVTCNVTVNGAQVRQRTGRGLTICSGIG